MKTNKVFIANWKMYFSFNQTINFVESNRDKFVKLQTKSGAKIILCPSYTEIYAVKQILKNVKLLIGAQNCSAHTSGPFTGEVPATTLKNIGCKYCIVGHSERRRNQSETDIDVANKAKILIDYSISPIICIGENEKEHKNNNTLPILKKQLYPVLEKIKSIKSISEELEIFIAYEPIWSIGTGKIASPEQLKQTFSWLRNEARIDNDKINLKLIYGGSVNHKNIKILTKINAIDGFLIGKASLSFQEFEKIIKSGILIG